MRQKVASVTHHRGCFSSISMLPTRLSRHFFTTSKETYGKNLVESIDVQFTGDKNGICSNTKYLQITSRLFGGAVSMGRVGLIGRRRYSKRCAP
jgi:hypothetical protein